MGFVNLGYSFFGISLKSIYDLCICVQTELEL